MYKAQEKNPSTLLSNSFSGDTHKQILKSLFSFERRINKQTKKKKAFTILQKE